MHSPEMPALGSSSAPCSGAVAPLAARQTIWSLSLSAMAAPVTEPLDTNLATMSCSSWVTWDLVPGPASSRRAPPVANRISATGKGGLRAMGLVATVAIQKHCYQVQV